MFGLWKREDGVAVTEVQVPRVKQVWGKTGNLVSDVLRMRCLFDVQVERPLLFGRQIFAS